MLVMYLDIYEMKQDPVRPMWASSVSCFFIFLYTPRLL